MIWLTKNIGISVKKSTKPPIDGEKNNPFNGSLSIRGKLFEGIVVNAKAKHTVTIEKNRLLLLPNLDDMEKVKIEFMHTYHLI